MLDALSVTESTKYFIFWELKQVVVVSKISNKIKFVQKKVYFFQKRNMKNFYSKNLFLRNFVIQVIFEKNVRTNDINFIHKWEEYIRINCWVKIY